MKKMACYIAKLYYNVYGVDCIPPHASEDDTYYVFLCQDAQAART